MKLTCLPLPCQEEAATYELLVVARVRLAIVLYKHGHDSGTAAVQGVSAAVRLAVTPSDAGESAVAASRHLHKPLLVRRRRLGAVVQDEVLVERADGEREADLGGAVVLGDAADNGAAAVRGSERLEFVRVGDDQGGVVVEDAEDLEPVVVPAVSEVRRAIDAADLEPDCAAVGGRRLLRDDPEREGDLHAAA
uniref:Uncharacterized protein n=1 Tax=Zea mays TaxID=4577 RepID=A0A804QK49_MAIZE